MNVHFNLYYNNVRQDPKNTKYPHSAKIRCKEDLAKVMSFDHVCAEYKDSYRRKDNFICADCCMFDVDNSESDNERDWITPEDVQKAFSDVPFYVSYSRNHLKVKDGKKARPKFHIYFPVDKITNGDEYGGLKHKVCKYFPKFDPNAKDCARFFYGVEFPNVQFISGNTLLTDFMRNTVISNDCAVQTNADIIPQGQRNTTMHRFALRVLTRYGDSDNTAYQAFLNESERCSPLLDDKELDAIWKGAISYYRQTIRTSPNYVSPHKYVNAQQNNSFELPLVDSNSFMMLCSSDTKNRKFDISTARLFLNAFGLSIKLNDMSNNIEVSGLPSKYNTEDSFELLKILIADTASKLSYKRTQAENGIDKGKFYRIKNGKDIKGLCKGFSVYTDIPVGWVRLITLILSPLLVIPYFIICAFVPYKENAESGIVRKKLYKVKDHKVFFGLCAGFSERYGKSRWFWRIFGVLLFPIYLILSAVIPTKEE